MHSAPLTKRRQRVKRIIDIVGQRFGNLTVISLHGKDSTNKTAWLCRCDCGTEIVTTGLNLKSGNTKSCGCFKQRSGAKKNLTGEKFGRLIVLNRVNREIGKAHWLCRCSCGKTTIVLAGHLVSGHTNSCGCQMKENTAKANRERLTGKRGADTPRWMEHLSQDQRDRRRDTRHKEWSADVLEREGYSCAVCRERGKMHAHHFEGYSRNPDLRYEPDNGVCLCESCHYTLHKAKGYREITREDFFSFFSLPNPDEGIDDWSSIPFPSDENIVSALQCVQAGSIEDLKKARWYLDDEIMRRERVTL